MGNGTGGHGNPLLGGDGVVDNLSEGDSIINHLYIVDGVVQQHFLFFFIEGFSQESN